MIYMGLSPNCQWNFEEDCYWNVYIVPPVNDTLYEQLVSPVNETLKHMHSKFLRNMLVLLIIKKKERKKERKIAIFKCLYYPPAVSDTIYGQSYLTIILYVWYAPIICAFSFFCLFFFTDSWHTMSSWWFYISSVARSMAMNGLRVPCTYAYLSLRPRLHIHLET